MTRIKIIILIVLTLLTTNITLAAGGTSVGGLCSANPPESATIGALCQERQNLPRGQNGQVTDTLRMRQIEKELMEEVIRIEEAKNSDNDPSTIADQARIDFSKQQIANQISAGNSNLNIATQPETVKKNSCFSFSHGLTISACIRDMVSGFLEFIILPILTRFVTLINISFSQTLYLSIRGFSTFVNNLNAINIGWGIVRDLMNLLFIGSLFYIAISTILQVGNANWKREVPRIIVAALLINFSMLFTKILIDASNLLTVTFYDNSSTPGQTVHWFTIDPPGPIGPIIGPEIKMNGNTIPDITYPIINAMSFGSLEESAVGSVTGSIANSLGKVILLMVTGYVLIVAGILFANRVIVLIFLLIMSPFAFIGMILPKGQEFANKWWKNLTDQLIFAPAFMLCFFVTLKIAEASADIKQALGSAGETGFGSSTLMFYTILNGMMFGCIFVAKTMGAKGADWAQETAGGLIAGFPARLMQETVGRRHRNEANSLRLQLQDENLDPAARARLESRLLRADKLSKSTFDIRNTDTVKSLGKISKADFGKGRTDSFNKRREDEIKAEKERAKLLAPQTDQEKAIAKEKNKSYLAIHTDSLDEKIRLAYDPEDQKRAALTAGIKNSATYKSSHESAIGNRELVYNASQANVAAKRAAAEQSANAKFNNDIDAQKSIINDKSKSKTEVDEAREKLNNLKQERAKMIANDDGVKEAIKKEIEAREKLSKVKDKANEYIDQELAKNQELTALVNQRVMAEKSLEGRGGMSDYKIKRIRNNAGSTEEADRKIKEYRDKQEKQKKDFESGKSAQQRYAESVAAGVAGSWHLPISDATVRIPFTSNNPSTAQANQERAAAVRSQAGGTSREDQIAELARQIESERAAATASAPATPPAAGTP